MFEKYTPILVRSTKKEITTVVAIKTVLSKSIFIKKALLSAPWFPVRPPKKPLNIPPIGNMDLLNFSFLKNGIRSIIAKAIKIIAIINCKYETFISFSIKLYVNKVSLLIKNKA